MRHWKEAVLCVVCCVWFCSSAAGQEYVTVKKDGTGDYTGIQEALDDLFRAYDEIVVYPGVYQENIVIGGDVTLRAYDGPYLTCIDGTTHTADREDTVVVNIGLEVSIVGFYITGGRYGIKVNTSTHALIANCVVHNNDDHGILLDWEYDTDLTMVELYNNVLVGNAGAGVYLDNGQHSNHATVFHCWVKNNIITQNQAYGIAMRCGIEWTGGTTYHCERLVIAYNNTYANVPDNYGPGIGEGECVEPGPGEIHEIPGFVGEANGCGLDVRLQSTSECRDAGSESHAFDDPDGTRNDMGAYGGPYSESFFESFSDGPIVRDIAIVPGSIPQGETFTVQSTAAVR